MNKVKEINPCFGCGCYDPDYESCTMPSEDLEYACKLYGKSKKEKQEFKNDVTTHEIADILYNMSLDMDYMDYEEFWQEEINNIEKEIEKLKQNDSVLYHALNTIAYGNLSYLGLLTKRN